MNTQHGKTLSVVSAALCGAAYAVLTLILAPISFGAVQFRVSELLCILPYYLPCTSWGLFAGCMLANLMTGNVLDVVFGSLATLAAALTTAAVGRRGRSIRHRLMACVPPVLYNAFVVGAVITVAYNGLSPLENPGVFALNALQVGLGEAGVMFLIGFPTMRYLENQKFFREFIEKVK